MLHTIGLSGLIQSVCLASYNKSVWPHTIGLSGLEVQLMTVCVGNASYNIGLSGLEVYLTTVYFNNGSYNRSIWPRGPADDCLLVMVHTTGLPGLEVQLTTVC